MAAQPPPDGRDTIFVSYSHEDPPRYRDALLQMLKPYVAAKGVRIWCDVDLRAGDTWRPEIEEALQRSFLGVLLVSPPFCVSEFILEQELPALERIGARIVPILVRPSPWKTIPAIQEHQFARAPTEALSEADERAFDRMVAEICEAVNELLPSRAPAVAVAPSAGTAPVAAIAATGTALAALDETVPPLPPEYVDRDEMAALKDALLAGGSGSLGISGKVASVGLHGQGGIGKTVLAAALARDPDVRRAFPDGVHWVTLGEEPDLLAQQRALAARIGLENPEFRSPIEGARALREALDGRCALLVVDDVWRAADAVAFRVTGASGRTLYTTRDARTLSAAGAQLRAIDVLSDAAARGLLESLAVGSPPAAEATRILAATGRVALALSLAGSAVRERGWSEVADELEREGESFLSHPYADVFKAMRVGVATLEPDMAAAYRQLAVFPEDARVPLATIARLWSRTEGFDAETTTGALGLLAARGLLSLADDRIAFHDLQRAFLVYEATDLPLLHAELLAAHEDLRRDGTWATLPTNEPYLWDRLIHHMRGAGDPQGVGRTCRDLAYIAARSFVSGPLAAEGDVAGADALLPDDPALAWLKTFLQRSGHLLAGRDSLQDVAGSLRANVRDVCAGVDAERLDSLLLLAHLRLRWDAGGGESAALRRVLEGHGDSVRSVAFSPVRATIASGGDDGAVRLWDAGTGAPGAVIEGHSGSVLSVAFSPDGTTIASGGHGGTVRLWDAVTGAPGAVLEGHSGAVGSVAFSPDGATIASGGDDGAVRLWDAGTGAPGAVIEGHSGSVLSVAFSPDGTTIAAGGHGGTVRLWDAVTGAPGVVLTGEGDWVTSLAFSPDGATIASGGDGGAVRLWDAVTRAPRVVLKGHAGWVWSVAVSPDGARIASGGTDGVRLWDAGTGALGAVLGQGSSELSVAFSPDGTTIASGGDDGAVRLWGAATGTPGGALEGYSGPVRSVAFLPDGTTIASGGDDGAVRLWNAATGAPGAVLEGHGDSVRSVAFSPDGATIASGGGDGAVRLRDAGTGAPGFVIEGHSGSVLSVAFSPDGATIASGGGGGAVRLRDAGTGAPGFVIEGHSGAVGSVAFSPDGATIASGGGDGTVRLWDAGTGAAGAVLEHSGWVWSVAFSPDGTTIASGGDDGKVRLWDAATGVPVTVLEDGPVLSIAFSPDGATIASGGTDGTVRLWDVLTGATDIVIRLGGTTSALAWSSGTLALVVDGHLVVYDVMPARGPRPD